MLDLGRTPGGSLEVPPLDDPSAGAGWYDGSPAPGAPGPAIVLGHVDSARYGPGVFYRLGDLRPGDSVEIGRADGSVAVFVVDAVRSYEKSAFPTREVYGYVATPALRLITCGGVFDSGSGQYESNVVAFASLRSIAPGS